MIDLVNRLLGDLQLLYKERVCVCIVTNKKMNQMTQSTMLVNYRPKTIKPNLFYYLKMS